MYDKETVKETVLNKINSKNIILFGVGPVAEKFYMKFRDRMRISHCVSNFAEEWGEKEFLGELDVKCFKKEDISENDYLIICGPYAFRTIELQLVRDGLKMYDHFVESNIADAIFSQKKIALFYGGCVLRDIRLCLDKVPSFQNDYTSVFIQTNAHQSITINRVLYYMKDIADCYVYTPRILDRDEIYMLKKEDLPETCKIISVSNISVGIYWPQIELDLEVYNPYYLHSYNARRNLDFYHSVYRKEDKNINQMVSQKISIPEIVKRLSDEDFYSEKEVLRNEKIAFKTIQMAERAVDVTIYDYVKENYREKNLYQNFMHPDKCIIWEYVRRLLDKMEVSVKEVDHLEQISPKHIHEGGDVPIYPSVIKHMQLKGMENKRYEILAGENIRYMTFEEAIEHIASYTEKAAFIKGMW